VTLDETLSQAFALLGRGVADRRHAFHTPTLATVGVDGAPRARTLVLRGFEPAERRIRLHSDARAGKVAELQAEPRCALHLYDAKAGLQMRLAGCASVHLGEDPVAGAGWAGSREFSRMCYAVEPAPGTPVPAPPEAPRDPEAGAGQFRRRPAALRRAGMARPRRERPSPRPVRVAGRAAFRDLAGTLSRPARCEGT
jgi:hypothetical protein